MTPLLFLTLLLVTNGLHYHLLRTNRSVDVEFLVTQNLAWWVFISRICFQVCV